MAHGNENLTVKPSARRKQLDSKSERQKRRQQKQQNRNNNKFQALGTLNKKLYQKHAYLQKSSEKQTSPTTTTNTTTANSKRSAAITTRDTQPSQNQQPQPANGQTPIR
mmetsp:Transcript_33482/g.49569  ORF Transcript_33482/g.49569 Transcript_33482/m.49569 type:complete len:109 (-) Transcript_33482:576-902(-)